MGLQQLTPLRVLHRRTLAVRERAIHQLRATRIAPHFVLLDLTTQAGTYVKEFVHGDFGRTTPDVGRCSGARRTFCSSMCSTCTNRRDLGAASGTFYALRRTRPAFRLQLYLRVRTYYRQLYVVAAPRRDANQGRVSIL